MYGTTMKVAEWHHKLGSIGRNPTRMQKTAPQWMQQMATKSIFKNDLKQRGGKTTDALSMAVSTIRKLWGISNLQYQTTNREEMAVSATSTSYRELAVNSLQSPFIICSIVYPWQDHKFNISYQETAIGNE